MESNACVLESRYPGFPALPPGIRDDAANCESGIAHDQSSDALALLRLGAGSSVVPSHEPILPSAQASTPLRGACPSKKAEGQIFSSESDPVRMKTNGREAEEKCASGRRFSSGKDCKFQQIVSRT